MLYVVVDGANVVGSRPNGWWRNRAGAAQRLAERLDDALRHGAAALAAAVGRHGSAGTDTGDLRVVLVLEGAAKAADPQVTDPRLEIVRAPADGDSSIAELTRELAGRGEDVVVVTADRGLRDRVHRAGGRTVGPRTLLRLLDTQRVGASGRNDRRGPEKGWHRRHWWSPRRARRPAR